MTDFSGDPRFFERRDIVFSYLFYSVATRWDMFSCGLSRAQNQRNLVLGFLSVIVKNVASDCMFENSFCSWAFQFLVDSFEFDGHTKLSDFQFIVEEDYAFMFVQCQLSSAGETLEDDFACQRSSDGNFGSTNFMQVTVNASNPTRDACWDDSVSRRASRSYPFSRSKSRTWERLCLFADPSEFLKVYSGILKAVCANSQDSLPVVLEALAGVSRAARRWNASLCEEASNFSYNIAKSLLTESSPESASCWSESALWSVSGSIQLCEWPWRVAGRLKINSFIEDAVQ
jgi:hypothetical protein